MITAVNLYNADGRLGFLATNRHRVYRYISDIAIANPEGFREGAILAVQFKGIVDSLRSSQVDMAIADNYLVLRQEHHLFRTSARWYLSKHSQCVWQNWGWIHADGFAGDDG